MTPERKQHLRSLDASETPHLAEVLDALDVEEKREREARREYDEAAKGWEEALARAEAAETAAATAWKRFEEMREAYKTNSRNYGGVVRERDEAQHVANGLGALVKEARTILGASNEIAWGPEPLVEAAKRVMASLGLARTATEQGLTLLTEAALWRERIDRAREEAIRKLDQVADEWKTKDAEVRHANAKLRAMRAGADDVWFWQGRGDDPQSLTCPVVMQPDTLRAMLEIIAAFQAYIHEWGIEHATVTVPADEGDDYPCPEDDTCTCPHVARINAAFAAYERTAR